MTSSELRSKFLEFFSERGHKVIPSSSLVPENDPSVLFTTAGMQQFKRYYLFPEEAPSVRITTCQKCVRTGDIDEVGDESHLTFFEMLGNFSFGYPEKDGAYFKEETIKLAWGFLTEVLSIDKNRIHANYFGGDDNIPEDKESLEILKTIPDLKEINATGFSETFWSLGTEGSPGGPTVEFYVDGLEVWNCVFNQYVMRGGKYVESELKGVDTGMGLERLTVVMQGKSDVYETDLFQPIIKKIEEISGKKYSGNEKAFRIIADHLRSAVALISDGVAPSNVNRGYVLRRLIRRAIRKYKVLSENFDLESLIELIASLSSIKSLDNIKKIIAEEREKFQKPLDWVAQYKIDLDQAINGGVIKKIKDEPILSPNSQMTASGTYIYENYQTYGVPPDMSFEIAKELGIKVDQDGYERAIQEHQAKSRTASAGMFKGGLADNKVETTRLHTAAHLLLAALRQLLSPEVSQKGSNITEERLRFDFNWPEKLTLEQISEVEKIVNDKIKEDIPVEMEELSLDDAKKSGASGVFDDRYGEKVKVYTIGSFSKEICGGPHVAATGELGTFKISKEESSSAGVRRIKAALE
ncbi:MAG: alanine--tRNA ligase [Candidatus Berkelbacteria bacterium]